MGWGYRDSYPHFNTTSRISQHILLHLDVQPRTLTPPKWFCNDLWLWFAFILRKMSSEWIFVGNQADFLRVITRSYVCVHQFSVITIARSLFCFTETFHGGKRIHALSEKVRTQSGSDQRSVLRAWSLTARFCKYCVAWDKVNKMLQEYHHRDCCIMSWVNACTFYVTDKVNTLFLHTVRLIFEGISTT